MKFFYKDKLLDDQKDIINELLVTGCEFSNILYEKIKPVLKNIRIGCFEGKVGNITKQRYILLIPTANNDYTYFSIQGERNLSKYSYQTLQNEMKVDNLSLRLVDDYNEVINKINKVTHIKATNILNSFYHIETNTTSVDKHNNKYNIQIISNTDSTIGEDLYVDELLLFDGNKKIGYLKAKYTTDEYSKLYNVDITSSAKIFINKATVDYSKLSDEYKNRGLGYVMYFHMAQHLNNKGIQFRQSTICSHAAQLLWDGINTNLIDYVTNSKIKVSNGFKNISFLSIGHDCILEFKNNKPIVSKANKNTNTKF
ncbi:hypothetical protein GW796_06910 [archaeon]|nr:hypothetical protein [archaeon]